MYLFLCYKIMINYIIKHTWIFLNNRLVLDQFSVLIDTQNLPLDS